ncbi:hypothetical protein, partial [Enterobacter asburiae]
TNQKTDTGKTLTRWPVLVDHNNYGLRAIPYASEEEIRFRDNFHKNILFGAQKAANDEKFRYEMISLGGFILASPSSRNF